MKKNFLFVLVLLGCSSHSSSVHRETASARNPLQPPIEQGEIWGREEAEYTDEISQIFRDTLIDATEKNTIMRRDAHPKAHGCVTATLAIDNSLLPQSLRVGLFGSNRNYQSIVRFSNGAPEPKKADAESDVRGMAIKVFNTPYSNYLESTGVDLASEREHHDIVLMSANEFFLDDPEDYIGFMRATRGRFGVGEYLALHWLSLKRILGAFTKPANPLDIDYGSATPYKLGSTSMKMKFRTCKKVKDTMPSDPGNDFLSERLLSSLSQREECYDFYVQPNRDPKNNQIEKAMTIWDEDDSPLIKVGRLFLNRQNDFRSAEKMNACEAMTFNPWRAHPDNRPLGGINRIRLEVYLKQFKLRQEYNRSLR